MPAWKLEPEFEMDYQAWKKDPSPVNTGTLVRQLQPSIDKGLRAYGGKGQAGLTTRGHAKKLAINALQTYDPTRAKLGTHVINHLQGLRRVQRGSTQVVHLPERVSLDRNRLLDIEADLQDRLGREPSVAELADYSGLSPKRIKYVRSFRSPVSESQFKARIGASGELEGYQPAVRFDYSAAWQEVVYEDLNPVNQRIMEWTLGMHGQPAMSNQEIAKKLGLTPGAISQRKAQIQQMLDEEQTLSPF